MCCCCLNMCAILLLNYRMKKCHSILAVMLFVVFSYQLLQSSKEKKSLFALEINFLIWKDSNNVH